MSEIIAQKAAELASDTVIMNSYKDFFNGKGYFLTKNSQLSGATRKPSRFPDTSKNFEQKWMSSVWFVTSQRKYILLLAGISDSYSVKNIDYNKLKQAYNKWSSKYYVVFYGGGMGWTCNLFVGETLSLAGKNVINNGRYYSAKQIWNGEGPFKKINKAQIKKGDIAAFGGYNVEIVTRVTERGIFIKDKISFCSRGAGSGGGREFGTEKCGDLQRHINNDRVKFLRVS